MKLLRSLLLFVSTVPMLDVVHGFPTVVMPATSSSSSSSSSTTTRLYGLFDFKPFHGRGSGDGKSDLDAQWEVQQEILAARRGSIDKSALKKKYANGARGDLSSLGGGRSSADGGTEGGGASAATTKRQDEMYVESPTKGSPRTGGGGGSKNTNKFFWEK
jgi:hypothetical protein